jgi:lipoate-protein ligase A
VIRAIRAGHLAPAEALALDEAVARAGGDPALLLWHTDPCVVVGRFQRIDWEIDAAACAARGVRVWRRFTGGGTVYLDQGTLCAALAVPAGHPDASLPIPELYAPLLGGIVAALCTAGVPAARDDRTVRVGGLKVTGIAAHRGRAGSMVHGTVLVSADLDALRACVGGRRDGDLKGLPRPSPSRPDHVANTDVADIADRLCAALGAEPGELTAAERDAAEELRRMRYEDAGWHAGPWGAVTPSEVKELLGGRRAGRASG